MTWAALNAGTCGNLPDGDDFVIHPNVEVGIATNKLMTTLKGTLTVLPWLLQIKS